MSRPNKVVTQFPALDHEPRGSGPPPSYRNSAATEDSWSTASGSSQAMAGKRRSSWNNLVQVGGDNMVHRQAAPSKPTAPPATTTFSIGSRTSSEIGLPQTVFHTQFSAHGQAMPMQKVYSNDPRLVSVQRPAGTIPASSVNPSRAPSVLTSALNPSPPLHHKSSDSSKFRTKRNRFQAMKNFCKRPRVIGCCLCLLMALIVAIVIIVILTQVLPTPKQATFHWIAPTSLTNGQNSSSTVDMKVDNERIRFQMAGAEPMKGNFINYYDFKNNQAVIIDQSLQSNGKNLYCFIMPLDRSFMPNTGQVRKAAKNSLLRHLQTEGWQEQWTFMPAPVQQTNGQANAFNPPIPECNGSRIVQLQATSDQRNRRCTDCYDFCLPEYGIMKDTQKDNEEYLNVVRRDCFYLFVPEWRAYAQANSIEQNQMDFENYYKNRQNLQVSYSGNGPNDSRWIPLSGMPRQMVNATGAFMGQVGNAASQFGSNVYGALTGQPQQQQQQNGNGMYGQTQQNIPNGYGQVPTQNGYVQQLQQPVIGQSQQQLLGQQQLPKQQQVIGQQQQLPQQQQQVIGQPQQQLMSSQYGQNQNNQLGQNQPAGYHPAVNGVVNLNGVNGNNGNTEYNGQQSSNTQYNGGDVRRNAYQFRSNVNSGYTAQQPQASSGNSQSTMNGFGASPSYQTSRYGFNGQQSQTQQPQQHLTNGMNLQNGQQQQQQQQQQNSMNQNGNVNHTPTTQPVGTRIGSVLNEFGNPVSIYSPESQPQQNAYHNIQSSLGMAETAPVRGTDLMLQNLQQSLNQNNQQNQGYRPNVAQVDYNIPNYNQNRPDALSRQGRIFKRNLSHAH